MERSGIRDQSHHSFPDFAVLRSEDLIISESLAQDFCSSSRRRNGRIASYATVSTTQKTDKKTSQDSDIIKSSLLRNEDLIICESLTQDFCSSSRRSNRRIASYATVATTQKTDKKTSQNSYIIESSFLSTQV